MKTRAITEKEWNEYDWIAVGGKLENLNSQVIYIRGKKRTQSPQDGFHYEEVTTLSDKEQKWARVLTFIQEEE